MCAKPLLLSALLLASPLLMAGDAPPRAKLLLFQKGFESPVALEDDGTGRIFVVEHTGSVRLIENGQLAHDPYLNLHDRVYWEGESGLLSMVFHPDFAKNGRIFVNYTAKTGDQERTVISEFKADPHDKKVDPSTERILLQFDQPWTNHKGGQLAFGNDGMLYISEGDGGSGYDPNSNGQNLKTYLSKMLRIDVNGKQPYAVPPDNPFVGKPGVLPEIYAFGLRNPWRFSIDHKTGLIWCGDVGQDRWEEIDIIEKGKNYGWSAREGMHDMYPDRAAPGVLTDPIKEYPHTDGNNCIIGGYVYRGKQFPDMKGIYIYGDNGSGRIFGLKWDGKSIIMDGEMISAEKGVHLSAFGQDKDGEIYVLDYSGGEVYRLVE